MTLFTGQFRYLCRILEKGIFTVLNQLFYMRYFFFTFACLLMLWSCNPSNRARTGKLKNRSAEYLQKKLIQAQVKVAQFSSKAKIRVKGDAGNLSLSSNILLQQDSQILITAKAFGIEAGRALIRPDSVFILNRINREYSVHTFDYLRENLGLPVNFTGLQAILLGNPVFFQTQFTAEKDSTHYQLIGSGNRFETVYKIDGFTYLLRQLFIAEPTALREAILWQDDYQRLSNKQLFAHRRLIETNSPEGGNSSISIEFSSVKIDEPINIRFTIPDRYQRTD